MLSKRASADRHDVEEGSFISQLKYVLRNRNIEIITVFKGFVVIETEMNGTAWCKKPTFKKAAFDIFPCQKSTKKSFQETEQNVTSLRPKAEKSRN